jgi:hypothetical protein
VRSCALMEWNSSLRRKVFAIAKARARMAYNDAMQTSASGMEAETTAGLISFCGQFKHFDRYNLLERGLEMAHENLRNLHNDFHGFTFRLLICLVLSIVRENTQRTQNPPTFGSWGFDSPSRHHLKNPQNIRLVGLARRMRCSSAADAADFASYIVANENLSH